MNWLAVFGTSRMLVSQSVSQSLAPCVIGLLTLPTYAERSVFSWWSCVRLLCRYPQLMTVVTVDSAMRPVAVVL